MPGDAESRRGAEVGIFRLCEIAAKELNEDSLEKIMEDIMSINKPNLRFHWLTAAAFGVLVLIATAVPLTPAKAFLGVHVGGVGIGVGGHHSHHYASYGRGRYHRQYR